MTSAHAGLLNLPNALTVMRLVLWPPILGLAWSNRAVPAAALFVAVMLTDLLDGSIARRRGLCTPFGTYLDPVVDKIIILSLFYELAAAGRLSMAVPHLFLARELLQNAIRATAAASGNVIAANWTGKTKAFLQNALIAWGLLLPWLHTVRPESADGMRMVFRSATWAVVAVTWAFLVRSVWVHRKIFAKA